MKTSHQFARELLAGPDLPIRHLDPSLAGVDPENDTGCTDPRAEKVDCAEEPYAFITICGEGGLIEDLGEISERTFDLLVAGGYVTREKLEQARDIARETVMA